MKVGEQVFRCPSLYIQVGNMKEIKRAIIWVVALGGLEVN
jgi:hypothetical protein